MKILHVEILEFFLTLERARRGIPREEEIVIHFPDGPACVVTFTKGCAALGLRTHMTMNKARALAPAATYVPADFQSYTQMSDYLNTLIRDRYSFTEQINLYEWFCDVSDQADEPHEKKLRELLCRRQPFALVVAEARNKFLAKVSGSTGRTFSGDFVHDQLMDVPIEEFWGIPRKWVSDFRQMGVETIGRVGKLDPSGLEKIFPRAGRRLVMLGQGRDDHEVRPFSKPSRLSLNGRVRLREGDEPIKKFLIRLSNELSDQLVKSGYLAFSIQLETDVGGRKIAHRYRYLLPTDRPTAFLVGASSMMKRVREEAAEQDSLDFVLSVEDIVYDRDVYQIRGSPRTDLEVMRD